MCVRVCVCVWEEGSEQVGLLGESSVEGLTDLNVIASMWHCVEVSASAREQGE